MISMKTKKLTLSVFLAAITVLTGGYVPAVAEELKPDTFREFRIETGAGDEVNPEVLEQAFDELINSDVPKENNPDSTVTFSLDGVKLTLRDPHALTPYASGGKENGGFWIEFTPMEQDMIISGSGFALGVAICAISGVGWGACTVIGALITGATVYLSHHKKCDDRLKMHYTWHGKVQYGECS